MAVLARWVDIGCPRIGRAAVTLSRGARLTYAAASETAWLATMRPSGSQLRFTSARRAQVSGGRIASTSQGRSAKLK